MTNAEIAKLLRHVAAAYAIKNEGKFRFQIIAYQRAADAIEASTTEIKDLIENGKSETFPGVGPSIQQHLEELIKTGNVKRFEWVFEGVPQAVFPLLDVPTFGPKKAYRLTSEFHLKDPKTVINDVEKLAKAGKIAPLDGFGEKSQADILRAISEFRLGFGKTTRMVLPFAAELADKIVAYLKTNKAVKQVNFLGSLRRMKETIGDVDIAVATDKPQEVIEHFVDYQYKERIIEKGPMSASILTSGGKQIDLMTVPIDSYGALLQHFTGSKNHNVHLRELALKKGMSLSERGIKEKSSNKIHAFTTEEAFYKALGLDWIPPEMREDTGEIELAASHTLPKIVELSDMKGDFHIHSSYPIEPSHDLGKDSMQIMLDKAKKLGYEYLAFSEHNPSVSKHNKSEIYSIMAKRKEKIEQLKESNKNIRIINMLELDILASGELAIDEKALSTVDACLVSIHSVFSMDKKDMTKRILNGLSHPKAKIFSHPTGRLLNERPGYEVDFEQLFEFCKKHNKGLEVNAWPSRLDLPDIMVRQAIKHGIKVSIDTDSHAVDQMDNMRFGVAVARRGWATPKDVVNTWKYEDVMKWMKE